MKDHECCICHSTDASEYRKFGQREFCIKHFNKLTYRRKSMYIAIACGILLSLILAIIAIVIDKNSGEEILVISGSYRLLIGLLPVLFWLVVFYFMDFLEPEPKRFVLGVFVLGVIVANGFVFPLLDRYLNVQEWTRYSSTGLKLILFILIYGFVQEYIKYIILRSTIFNHKEFDERADGLIYGAAIGLGFSLVINFRFLSNIEVFALTPVTIKIITTTLGQACWGAVSGFFLSISKFEHKPLLWVPIGVVIAAILNGVNRVAIENVSRTGLVYTPVKGLFLSIIFTSLTFGVLIFVLVRINNSTITEERDE